MEKIIGLAILGKISRETADIASTAILLTSRHIQCPVCGVILDRSRMGWAESNGVPLPHSHACIDCFRDAIPRLKKVVELCKLQGVIYRDSSTIDWKGL